MYILNRQKRAFQVQKIGKGLGNAIEVVGQRTTNLTSLH